MAESVVSILLEKISYLLGKEVALLKGARSDFEEINRELESMRSLLRIAGRRQEMDDGTRTWVTQVRRAAFDIKDIIDEFVHHIDGPPMNGIRGRILGILHFIKTIYSKHPLAVRLKEMKIGVQNISERRIRYDKSQLEEGTTSSSQGWQPPILGAETWVSLEGDEMLVGMEKELDTIVRWLLEEDEHHRSVLSVTGMGGLGKTTLAIKAFKCQEVKDRFDCLAFVSVSQTLRINDFLQSLIKQLLGANKEVFPVGTADMGVGVLGELINRHLQSRKYAIVLDDIWNLNDWEEISSLFPDCQRGSRLVVTTRDATVARALGGGGPICELSHLNENEAWELFSNKAFRKQPCPRELEPLARRIAGKCEGLPLAINAMGGLLLTTDRGMREWTNIEKSLNWQLSNNTVLKRLNSILLLSYYYLPYYLRHCFLYCSMFLEDHPIRRKQLIRLWVAEGFVKERGGMTMEEVAEEYLKELIHRSMLQVIEVNPSGRVKACKLHDVMREVAISLSKEEDLGSVISDETSQFPDQVRCISVHDSGGKIFKSHFSSSRLRSLLVLNTNNVSLKFSSALPTIPSRFRLLRLLSLEKAPIDRIPHAITDLFNLKYLNLGATRIHELPNSLGKLRNLQTLDLRGTRIKRLPIGIGELQNLRHLFCYRITKWGFIPFHYLTSIKVPTGLMCHATCLQSLTIIEAEEEILEGIGNLTQLRRLDISKVRATDGAKLCSSIGKMEQLIRLGVFARDEEETLELEGLSRNPPPLLQKLLLQGHLKNVPAWVGSLNSLTHLWLHWSRLTEQDGLLVSLQELPNLVFLYLHKAFEGQELLFRDGWFPKLKILHLLDLIRLSSIVIEKGAVPHLQQLFLVNCRELKMLPKGFEFMADLQELILQQMPTKMVDGLPTINETGGTFQDKSVGVSFLHLRKTQEGGWQVKQTSFQKVVLLYEERAVKQILLDLLLQETTVLKVVMDNYKCGTKAMKIVASAGGVMWVAIDRDSGQLVLSGEGVDVVQLVSMLRKKVGHTELLATREPVAVQADKEIQGLPYYYHYP
ncbi:hypothetical protein ACLOJK_041630 [Asimina triloba]